jgi:hypothetical protein
MKYIKKINEFRTVGYRYSEPKEEFKVSIIVGSYNTDSTFTLDKLISAIELVDELKYNKESFKISPINQIQSDTNGTSFKIDSQIIFEIFLYKEEDFEYFIEELGEILKSAYDTDLLDSKYIKKYNIKNKTN